MPDPSLQPRHGPIQEPCKLAHIQRMAPTLPSTANLDTIAAYPKATSMLYTRSNTVVSESWDALQYVLADDTGCHISCKTHCNVQRHVSVNSVHEPAPRQSIPHWTKGTGDRSMVTSTILREIVTCNTTDNPFQIDEHRIQLGKTLMCPR